MRIFDRIASGESVLATAFDERSRVPSEMAARFRKSAHSYVRVIADEAAQFQAQTDAMWDLNGGDFGYLRLPFEQMWLEYKMPGTFLVDGKWQRATPPNQRYAALIEQDGDDAWSMICLFSNGDHSPVNIFPVAIMLSGLGDPATSVERRRLFQRLPDHLVERFGSEELAVNALVGCLVPAYLTIGWLNCRGISSERVSTAGSNKRRTRKGQPAGLDYRRLVLDWRIRNALERNNTCQREGKRLHVVRGHIRHYTAERPGFGSYVGNMWIHPHTRGDADLGRINHEYHVTSRGAQ